MTQPFLGEVRSFPYNFAPRGWAFCNGQILSIQQNTALFSLLGTFYGGNGTSNFALPNLQSRVPIGFGPSVGGPTYDLGETGGEENITLTQQQMPAHSHALNGTNTVGPKAQPAAGDTPGTSNKGQAFYANVTPDTTINSLTLGLFGNGLPHTNIQPYLAISWCIALQGIYPSRN